MMKLLAYLLVVVNIVFALYMLLTPSEPKQEIVEVKKEASFSNLAVGEKKPIEKNQIEPVKVEVCYAINPIKTN